MCARVRVSTVRERSGGRWRPSTPAVEGRLRVLLERTCGMNLGVQSSLLNCIFSYLPPPFSLLQKQNPISSGPFHCWLLDILCDESPPTFNLWHDTNFQQLRISNNLTAREPPAVRRRRKSRDWLRPTPATAPLRTR